MDLCSITPLKHAKMTYVEYIMHKNSQLMALNIYMELMYNCARLRLGIYGPHIHIYSDLGACAQSVAQYIL